MATNKQAATLNQQGELAKKMYSMMADASKDYNTRRKDQTNALRKTLEPVWKALAAGKLVNGCASKVKWCKWANPNSKNPERWFYSVMKDKGLKSVQSKRKREVVVLHDGMILSAHGIHTNLVQKEYEVLHVRKHGVSLMPLNEKQNIWMLEIRVRPLVAEGERIEPKPNKAEQAKAQAAAA